MVISSRKFIGIGGLIALVVTVQVSASLRRGDWNELLNWESWLWALTPAAFMGLWGWLTLVASRMCDTESSKVGLNVLAAIYFAIMVLFTADIVANGNSTSGIAFLLIPMFSTILMLPLIALIAGLGSHIDRAAVDD